MISIEFKRMTVEQLETVLVETKELLEDVLKERKFWFYNTAIHIPISRVRYYSAEIKKLTEAIEQLEDEIKTKS